MTTRQRVEKIEEEIEGVVSQYGVNSWELNFLRRIKDWSGKLTDKQEQTLSDIETKVFNSEDEVP